MLLPPQTNEMQLVTHLNYTGWPDHGTPTQPEQLLTFISYMRHVHRSGPIITHCSAGIGRSGTLICIDTVLGLISKDTDVSGWSCCMYCLFFFLMYYNCELIKDFPVVWYFRCGKEHETSETGNGSDRGEFWCAVLALNSSPLSCFNPKLPFLTFTVAFQLFFFFLTGPIYFLLSSDPLCPQMPSSRGKHLRIEESIY